MPLIYPSRGNRMGPTSVGPPPTPAQQVEDSVRCYSCPDYDSDYLVTARVPSEDSSEQKAAHIVSFLHSYALNGKKARDDTVKKKWLDAGIFQNPDSVIYKRLLEEDSTDSDYEPTEADLRQWLKVHKKRKRLIEKLQKSAHDPENGTNKTNKYKYRSWGILNRCEPLILEADFDEVKDQLRLNIRPDEVEAMLNSEKKIKKRFAGAHVSRGSSAHQWGLLSSSSSDDDDSSIAENSDNHSDSDSEDDVNRFPASSSETPAVLEVSKKNVRRKKEKTPHQLALEAAAKRRKLWIEISKKDVHRAFKSNQNSRKDTIQLCKKLAVGCMREVRKKALISQKVSRENASRSRRLCREMQAYWKRYDRAEKDQRKRAEKEALEQLKVDAELREAKRQQRKLNFLITQTELYAHFMSRKKAGDNMLQDQATKDILGKLDHGADANNEDEVDSERLKSEALGNARNAFLAHKHETEDFDADLGMPIQAGKSFDDHEDLPQPRMFQGKLKCYQLKGMSWLYGLYDRGINGILADEMGLGKTVQTIAFLSALVERQSIWGPFLVIAPASTLHNWQQELSKFVPQFKVVPYWGNASDRKVLRKFWTARNQDLHTEHSSFHVVVTSYQLVIQDVKYFQRIKWQYMVLDEAQAIKSTSSQRWKVLLGFTCRNRLLLTGTPIQNAMQELWGLLHFIMPYLFDSHQEFNEWFSKDIESHAENKTAIDEKHLSRLHMILKPFMLRRIKKDVENELSDKIEIRVDCPLTQRQKVMCHALKKKIRIEDLMQSTGLDGSSQAATSATTCLMNIVMQFRKVCNHPDLFEREDVRSPFFMKLKPCRIPKTFFDSNLFIRSLPSKSLPNIWHPGEILRQSKPVVQRRSTPNVLSLDAESFNNAFEFISLTGLSPAEVSRCFLGSRLDKLQLASEQNSGADSEHYRALMGHPNKWYSLPSKLPSRTIVTHSALKGVLFAVKDDMYCCGSQVTITPIPETPAHYEHRVRKANENFDDEDEIPIRIKVEKIRHRPRPALAFSTLLPTPPFMTNCLMSVCLAASPELCTSHNRGFRWLQRANMGGCREAQNWFQTGFTNVSSEEARTSSFITPGERLQTFGISACRPSRGWSHIVIPSKERLVTQSGKLHALDDLLKQLKSGGHRVLIYSQMTRMIDLLEEFMIHRKYIYIRLDGSSRISDRRDMVNDFQERADIFVFLLSTRAGGLGINLTAADTVIFYDSDWNPTVDQQAMDRAHRLGQTKQVTVYRLICQGSIEERILERAKEKSEIQRMVMSGTHMRPQDALKPKEVVSLLLDDEELERKFRQKQEERRLLAQAQALAPPSEVVPAQQAALTADSLMSLAPKRKRNNRSTGRPVGRPKRARTVEDSVGDSVPASPTSELSLNSTAAASAAMVDDDRESVLVVDEDYQQQQPPPMLPQQQPPPMLPQQQPPTPTHNQVKVSPSSRTSPGKTRTRSPKMSTPRKKKRSDKNKQSTPLNNTNNQKSTRPPSAMGSVGLSTGNNNVVLDVDVPDPVFAWNDLNLDNLEEIDVNDIDLSTLENVKV